MLGAFLGVVRREHRVDELALRGECVGVGVLRGHRHDLLGGAHCERAVRSDACGEFLRDGQCLAGLGDPVDEAVLEGDLGGERVAGDGHLHGQRVRQDLRQAQQTTGCGSEAALDLGDAELRFA